MSLSVLSIRFAFDPGPGFAGGLRLRRNASQPVELPEWRQGVTQRAEHSPAAYSIRDTAGKAIAIKARFTTSPQAGLTLQIRAVHPQLRAFQSAWQTIAETQVNVLGEAVPRQVRFAADGVSDEETFVLSNTSVASRGVGVYRVVWRWQYRAQPGEPWADFAWTEHQVYSVLQPPTDPWAQAVQDDARWPWTEVLEYACRWAWGARTPQEAAAAITRSVYSLGNGILIYDDPLGQPHYSYPYFNCTELLNQLRSGSALGPRVNCSDCAAVVSTFANILGCDLWQSQMGTAGTIFPLNLIVPIGQRAWQVPRLSGGFSFHEVAWANGCTDQDEVYDACLALDAYGDPGRSPRWPSVAANVRFGRMEEPYYRFRLVARQGLALCEAQPDTRQRRKLAFTGAARPAPAPMRARRAALRSALRLETKAPEAPVGEALFVWNFAFVEAQLDHWQRRWLDELARQPAWPRIVRSVWRSAAGSTLHALRVDVHECDSRAMAMEWLLELATQSQTGAYQQAERSQIGDRGFAAGDDAAMLFCRGNVVIAISNAGRQITPVSELARRIDAELIAKPNAASSSRLIEVRALRARPRAGKDVSAGAARQRTTRGAPRVLQAVVRPEGMVKIFAVGGEVLVDKGELVFRPAPAKAHAVTVYAYEQDRTVASQRLNFKEAP